MRTKKFLGVALLVAGLVVFSHAAYAETCDLTAADPGDACLTDINGAYFSESNLQATGTGLINPFVQIAPGGNPNNNGVEMAYNTTENGTLDVGAPDNFNHAVLLTDIPVVDCGDGNPCFEFILDINENNGGLEEYLSLDQVQVFQSTIANQDVETCGGGGACTGSNIVDLNGSLKYNLDSGPDGNSEVLLNYDINSGSGSGDLIMLIPISAFDLGGGQYVYVYSFFGLRGGDFQASDGFEEWTFREGGTPVPEPATLLLLGTGLLGVGRQVRRRMKKS